MKNLFRMMVKSSQRRSVRASERGAKRHAPTLPRSHAPLARTLSRILPALLLALGSTPSSADTNFAVVAGSFVEGFQNFVTVASGVDPADGTTYILGHDNASHAVLTKYDSSGARLLSDGDGEVV